MVCYKHTDFWDQIQGRRLRDGSVDHPTNHFIQFHRPWDLGSLDAKWDIFVDVGFHQVQSLPECAVHASATCFLSLSSNFTN